MFNMVESFLQLIFVFVLTSNLPNQIQFYNDIIDKVFILIIIVNFLN